MFVGILSIAKICKFYGITEMLILFINIMLTVADLHKIKV